MKLSRIHILNRTERKDRITFEIDAGTLIVLLGLGRIAYRIGADHGVALGQLVEASSGAGLRELVNKGLITREELSNELIRLEMNGLDDEWEELQRNAGAGA